MSNTRTTAIPVKPVVPQGDMGIGLCLACLGAVAVGEAMVPSFAVTFAPMPWPPGQPIGLVAVPCCWAHLQEQATALTKKPLIAARGNIR
jgi:hypothetical protein